jgi:hypothetical protein
MTTMVQSTCPKIGYLTSALNISTQSTISSETLLNSNKYPFKLLQAKTTLQILSPKTWDEFSSRNADLVLGSSSKLNSPISVPYVLSYNISVLSMGECCRPKVQNGPARGQLLSIITWCIFYMHKLDYVHHSFAYSCEPYYRACCIPDSYPMTHTGQYHMYINPVALSLILRHSALHIYCTQQAYQLTSALSVSSSAMAPA